MSHSHARMWQELIEGTSFTKYKLQMMPTALDFRLSPLCCNLNFNMTLQLLTSNVYVFIAILSVLTAFGRISKLTLPFLSGLSVTLSGVDSNSWFELANGWGIFNQGVDAESIAFYLSNNASGYKDKKLVWRDSSTFVKSSWRKDQKTIFVIPGYIEDYSGGPLSFSKPIVTALLSEGRQENIVFVDWHDLSRQVIYFDTARNAQWTGVRVAEFLIYCVQAGFIQSLADVRFIGFSLGAHVSGIAAHLAKQTLGENVARITGLDPAGPGFIDLPSYQRLSREDATFVDVIHVNTGHLIIHFGTPVQSGHVDFYPNGGEHQPGCTLPFIGEILGICSHLKVVDYYINSIKRKRYLGCPCPDYWLYELGACDCTDGVQMGESVDHSARGKIYLKIPLGQ